MTSIRDVAQQAGVSTATVSHVLNGTRYVREETAALVRRAAEELNYRPSRVASTLRSRKSMAVGAVIPLPDLVPYTMHVLEGAEEALNRSGYDVMFSNSKGESDRERTAIEMLETRLIDGLLWMPMSSEVRRPGRAQTGGMPTVLLEARAEGFDSVTSDVYPAVRDTVGQLLDRGKRRIAIVRSNADRWINAEKLRAYTDAHVVRGVTIDPALVRPGDPTFESGEALTRSVIEDAQADAVFLANHRMLIGGVRAIQHSRRSVPAELSVLGVEHYEWMDVVVPPISLIEQTPVELGATAARLLLARMADPEGSPRSLTTHASLRSTVSLW